MEVIVLSRRARGLNKCLKSKQIFVGENFLPFLHLSSTILLQDRQTFCFGPVKIILPYCQIIKFSQCQTVHFFEKWKGEALNMMQYI